MPRQRRFRLVHVDRESPGYTRRRCGRGFSYLDVDGKNVLRGEVRDRLRTYKIPPVWTDVWIATPPNGHLLATGRDSKRRVQYLYHPLWHRIKQVEKFSQIAAFGNQLPKLRRRLRRDLNDRRLSKRRVIASVIRLLDRGHLRIGNEQYFEANGTRGATTLDTENVHLDGQDIQIEFQGKSGQARQIDLRDPLLARSIRDCSQLDSQFLFAYRDTRGDTQPVRSTDVNRYLRRAIGGNWTAKTFRTWGGSVAMIAAAAEHPIDLRRDPSGQELRGDSLRRAAEAETAARVRRVASTLGNTPAVCRESYIHPELLQASKTADLDRWIDHYQPPSYRSDLNVDEVRLLDWIDDNEAFETTRLDQVAPETVVARRHAA